MEVKYALARKDNNGMTGGHNGYIRNTPPVNDDDSGITQSIYDAKTFDTATEAMDFLENGPIKRFTVSRFDVYPFSLIPAAIHATNFVGGI